MWCEKCGKKQGTGDKMEQKFMPRIDFEIDQVTGCFVCTSHVAGKRGYPRFSVKVDGEKKCTPVHRVVYEFFNGSIPKRNNIMVRHLCDNKMCINPKHLTLGTHKDNMADAYRNRKILRGEQKPNSKLTPEGVVLIRELYKAGTKQKEIASILGVCRSCVCNVLRGKSWFHVL